VVVCIDSLGNQWLGVGSTRLKLRSCGLVVVLGGHSRSDSENLTQNTKLSTEKKRNKSKEIEVKFNETRWYFSSWFWRSWRVSQSTLIER